MNLQLAHWYWNRARRMSLPEITYRAVGRFSARLHRSGVLTARVVPRPSLSARSFASIAASSRLSTERYVVPAEAVLEGKLSTFGIEYRHDGIPIWNLEPKSRQAVPLLFGKTLDYRDPALVGNIKYLWEPNRHLHLAVLAQAYRLSGEGRYLEGLGTQLQSWFDQCPYLLGPNWTSSLEAGIRLINWSIVWELIGGSKSAIFSRRSGEVLLRRWLESVYQHMHFIRGHLSRYSSANNHLIGELSGLFIAGHTWPYWRETTGWRFYAKKHLLREALLQNATDGVNREQAIAYQQFVLDFLLLAALTGRANGDDFPVLFWQRIEKMLEFLAAAMDVNGQMPMIGDADDGYVVRLSQERDFSPYRSLLATGAVLFSRPDFKFKARSFDDKSRWLLGDAGARKFAELQSRRPRFPRAFPEGGYYILGCDLDTKREVRLIVDAGPLGYLSIAAHGHADALAFTLSLGGVEFLVDPGTYCYHTEREWRDYFRGTRAHNTVCVDGQDQSVSGGNFLWVRHAQARCVTWEEGKEVDRFVGEHNGYARLADPVVHRRELKLDKSEKRFNIVDTIECKGRHTIERCWHFAEDVSVNLEADGTINATKDSRAIRLRPTAAVHARLARGETNPPLGWISRRFDVKTPTATVIWTSEIAGSTQLAAVLECFMPVDSSSSEPVAGSEVQTALSDESI